MSSKEQIPLSEDLRELTGNAEEEVKVAVEKINSKNADWMVQIEWVTKARRAVLFHPLVLIANKPLLKSLVVTALDAVDNLRSLVSRNAIALVTDMFSSLGKALDGDLDLMMPRLLKKFSDSSKFFEEDLDRAMMKVVPNVTGSKLLTVLLPCATTKNLPIRVKATVLIARTVTTVLGSKVLRFKDLQKLLQVLASLGQDSSVDVKNKSRQTIYAIFNYTSEAEFEKLLREKVTPNEAKVLKDSVDKMKKEATIGLSPTQSSTSSPAPSPGPSASPSQIAKPPKKVIPVKSPRDIQLTPKRKEMQEALREIQKTSPSSSGRTSPAPTEEYQFRAPAKALVVLGGDMEENIKVAVRMRPLDAEEKIPREIWETQGPTVVSLDPKHKNLSYTFDHVYSKEVQDSHTLYQEVGAQIVSSVMSGYNGTIFAYGQTSSGKTYTMMGTDDNPGIIPIAIYDVFEHIKNAPDREFLLRVSYMEIYNEIINDLLNLEGSNLNIREDKKSGIYVEGLKEEIVVSPDHVLHVISSGEAQRHVASTDYNLTSSRSHTIFRVIIESNKLGDVEGKSVSVSALTLIDLAGSEKVVSTSAMRRREGAYINKSLLTLGTIVSKLSERKKGEKIGYLPYRDSKLTRVLESSLSGNSRIALIATVNPAFLNFEESNNTLKFAARTKKITSKATLNQDSEKILIMKYKKQIEELKTKLKDASAAEQRLKDLEDKQMSVESQLVQELKDELQEQENLRTSLEEKIKQLTKLILVSTSVTSSSASQSPQSRSQRSRTGISMDAVRSFRASGVEVQTKLANVRRSIDLTEDLSTSPGSDDELLKPSVSMHRVNLALRIRADSLQQQCEWREKKVTKMQAEMAEKDAKLEAYLKGKVPDNMKNEVEQFKLLLKQQYEEQVGSLKEAVERQKVELDVLRADNRLMQEKLDNLKRS